MRHDVRLTPADELTRRHSALRQLMGEQGIDAVLLLQNADLFYFTGTIQAGICCLGCAGEPLYLVRRDLVRARRESSLALVEPLVSPRELPGLLSAHGLPTSGRIGLELDVLPVALYQRFRSQFPAAELVDVSPLIRQVRMIKSDHEVHILREAAAQADLICCRAEEVLREGMTDLQLAAELEYTARCAGHQGFLRMRAYNGELLFAHVSSGADSTVPSYLDAPLGGVGTCPAFGQGAGRRIIGRHEPVVVDFGGTRDGYLVDQTRIFSIGQLPERFVHAYEQMLQIQALMVERAVPGLPWGELYEVCRSRAEAMGFGDYFMGTAGAQVPFIGHGVGIEIDEFPFIARGRQETLQVGMVFAFEPKVVFAGAGAVGIENTFHLGGDGLERLTYSDERIRIL